MRYLLMAALLVLPVAAMASDWDTEDVELTIEQYLDVTLTADATPWTPNNYNDPEFDGNATWNGDALVKANAVWDLETTATALESTDDSIQCNDDGTTYNEQPITGNGGVTKDVSISWDRDGLNDTAGTYTATVTVTISVD